MNGDPARQELTRLYLGGDCFDPLSMAQHPDMFAELMVENIEKSRLAMFSMFGFFVQEIVTSKGPVETWAEHVADRCSANACCDSFYALALPFFSRTSSERTTPLRPR